jgi:hypothetical protein
LIERLAGLHIGALGEQAALDDAVDLRPHLRNAPGHGASGKLDSECGTLWGHGDYTHFDWATGATAAACGRCGGLGFAAARGDASRRCAEAKNKDWPHRISLVKTHSWTAIVAQAAARC